MSQRPRINQRVYREDTEVLTWPHNQPNEDGPPQLDEIRFYVAKEVDGQILLAKKLSSHPEQFDVTNDEIIVTLNFGDTAGIPEGRWLYDLEIQKNGLGKTIAKGWFFIEGDISTDVAGEDIQPPLFGVTGAQRAGLDAANDLSGGNPAATMADVLTTGIPEPDTDGDFLRRVADGMGSWLAAGVVGVLLWESDNQAAARDILGLGTAAVRDSFDGWGASGTIPHRGTHGRLVNEIESNNHPAIFGINDSSLGGFSAGVTGMNYGLGAAIMGRGFVAAAFGNYIGELQSVIKGDTGVLEFLGASADDNRAAQRAELALGSAALLNASIQIAADEVVVRNSDSNILASSYRVSEVVANISGSYDLPVNEAAFYLLTVTGDVSVTLTGVPDAGMVGSVTVAFIQDGIGGHSVTITNPIKYHNGQTPAIGLSPGEETNLSFIIRQNGEIRGYIAGQNMS